MAASFYIFLGAGIGGVLRHAVNVACARALGGGFPWGTLSVNVLGSFAIGALAAWLASRSDAVSQPLRLFLVTGLLGGFTTFSAFSLDVAVLWERGASAAAAGYIVASLTLSIAAAFAGLALVRSLS